MLDVQIQFSLSQESKTVCSLADVGSFARIVENRETGSCFRSNLA